MPPKPVVPDKDPLKPSVFKLQKDVPTAQYGMTAIIATALGLLFGKSLLGIILILLAFCLGLRGYIVNCCEETAKKAARLPLLKRC